MTHPTDPFLEKGQTRLEELQAARTALIQQMQQAQAELHRINSEAEELLRLMEGYVTFMEVPRNVRAGRPKPRVAHDDLPRGSYAPLAYEALIELGGEATLGQIVDYLRRTGRIPDAEHSYYSTRSALNRHERVQKTEKGFRLKELAPNQASDVA